MNERIDDLLATVIALRATKATLLETLRSVMVMFPDMCADANMCDDPHTLSIINKAREAIREAQ